LKFVNILLISFIFNWTLIYAQSYIPGESYFSHNEYIEYVHGNLPIIISAPHGGEKRPSSIPDRDCQGCVYQNDTNTQELANEVAAAIYEITGCYPYLILNRLHRIKLDANREIQEAADGNSEAELAWSYFHDHVSTASEEIRSTFSKGIFFDLHGHAHSVQRLELGYLLSKSNLQLDNVELDSSLQFENSSIRNLVNENESNFSFSELLRGDYSIGSLVEERGYASVPSNSDPYPLVSEPYFSGGHNTRMYGSVDSNSIDAIQIECNQDVRFDEVTRKNFATDLAQAIIEFVDKHYFDAPIVSFCKPLSIYNVKTPSSVFPIPASDFINIQSSSEDCEIHLIDVLGQTLVKCKKDKKTIRMDVSKYESGFYWIRITKKDIVVEIIPISII